MTLQRSGYLFTGRLTTCATGYQYLSTHDLLCRERCSTLLPVYVYLITDYAEFMVPVYIRTWVQVFGL